MWSEENCYRRASIGLHAAVVSKAVWIVSLEAKKASLQLVCSEPCFFEQARSHNINYYRGETYWLTYQLLDV